MTSDLCGEKTPHPHQVPAAARSHQPHVCKYSSALSSEGSRVGWWIQDACSTCVLVLSIEAGTQMARWKWSSWGPLRSSERYLRWNPHPSFGLSAPDIPVMSWERLQWSDTEEFHTYGWRWKCHRLWIIEFEGKKEKQHVCFWL